MTTTDIPNNTIPVIAIVGQPNVGKSTLFNCITKTRDALVADVPGVTRDRIYGQAVFEQQRFIVIDTGGIGLEENNFDTALGRQSRFAIEEADAIIFIVDARAGLTAADQMIANELRQTNKPCLLVANKIDGVNNDLALSEFHELGMGEPQGIAALQKRGVRNLLSSLFSEMDFSAAENAPDENDNNKAIRVAIIGRPNVGKSTLINRVLGEERVLVFDKPGTTLDSVSIPFEQDDTTYTLIDTAGMRRRARVGEGLEKFSLLKTIKSIESCHVALLMVDAREGITDQDLHILGFTLNAGRSLVIVINKWDGLTEKQRERCRHELRRRLVFVSYARLHFISALHGSGVGDLYDMINEAHASATANISTPRLSQLLSSALVKHPPPLHHGRRIKLRYAHQGGQNPPVIVIHGNQTDAIPRHYQQFLRNYFIDCLNLVGTPIQFIFKTSKNPFSDRKNKLNDRQIKKRQRLMKFVKKKK